MKNHQKTEAIDLAIDSIKKNEEAPGYPEIEEMRKKLGDNFIENLFRVKDYFLKNQIFRMLYLIMDMLLENLKKPKFFRMGFICYLESKEREKLISQKKSSCCYTCGKGIKGNFIFLIVIAIFNIIFGISSKVTSFLNRVNDVISKEEKKKSMKTMKMQKQIVINLKENIQVLK